MSACRRNFDETKYMYFLIKNDDLFGKKSAIVNIEFNSEPVDDQKHLKTKIKSYNGKFNTFSQ